MITRAVGSEHTGVRIDWQELRVVAVQVPEVDVALRAPFVRHSQSGEVFALVEYKEKESKRVAPISAAELEHRFADETLLPTPDWVAQRRHAVIVLSAEGRALFRNAWTKANELPEWPSFLESERPLDLTADFTPGTTGYSMSYRDLDRIHRWVRDMATVVRAAVLAWMIGDLKNDGKIARRDDLEALLWLGLSACFLNKENEQTLATLLGVYFYDTNPERLNSLSRGDYPHQPRQEFLEVVEKEIRSLRAKFATRIHLPLRAQPLPSTPAPHPSL